MDYSEFVELAQELLADAGRPITLIKYVGATGDKPWSQPSQTVGTTRDTFGAFVAQGKVRQASSFASNDLLQTRSQQVYVPCDGDETDNWDALQDGDGGPIYRITSCDPLKPGSTSIFLLIKIAK